MAVGAEGPGPTSTPGVILRYRERSRILVTGTTSGRSYTFSAAKPTQAVDVRDSAALLRTGFFERVGK
jgi:hypothetical protein